MNNIPFYPHTHARILPILLIHSSVNGHLGCFHFLPIVISATMNTDLEIALPVPAFTSFGYRLRSGLAGSYGDSMFIFFEELPYCTVPVPLHIATTNAQGFQFLHILTNTCSFRVFLIAVIPMSVILICMSLLMWSVFSGPVGHLEKCLFKSFL